MSIHYVFDLNDKTLIPLDIYGLSSFYINIDGNTYYCKFRNGIIHIYNDDEYSEYFMKISTMDFSPGMVKTGVLFKEIKGLNKLETIIHIRVTFCKKLGLKTTFFLDIAVLKCENVPYDAISYRLFATKKLCNDLSIYNKFFKPRKCPVDEKELYDLRRELEQKEDLYDLAGLIDPINKDCEKGNKIKDLSKKYSKLLQKFREITVNVSHYIDPRLRKIIDYSKPDIVQVFDINPKDEDTILILRYDFSDLKIDEIKKTLSEIPGGLFRIDDYYGRSYYFQKNVSDYIDPRLRKIIDYSKQDIVQVFDINPKEDILILRYDFSDLNIDKVKKTLSEIPVGLFRIDDYYGRSYYFRKNVSKFNKKSLKRKKNKNGKSPKLH